MGARLDPADADVPDALRGELAGDAEHQARDVLGLGGLRLLLWVLGKAL